MAIGAPPIVLDYLKEGNSKEDLIEWLWALLSDNEKSEIEIEAHDNEFLTIYYYQDGRDFYMFLKEDDVKSEDGLWRTYRSIIKVPDWDLEAAIAAEQNFLQAYCKEYKLNPIKLKMF